MIKIFEEFDFNNKRTIYHFTESYESLCNILEDDTLLSGESPANPGYGRGYENISFTWNPNLWDIEYVGDYDYRYKVRIAFDYQKMSKKWKFKSFDYFERDEYDAEEQEEIVETDEMQGIRQYITKVSLSSEYSTDYITYLKSKYPEIRFVYARRKKFKVVGY